MNKIEIKYLLLIIVIFIAACIETDIYLPAFPDMMNFFATTEEGIQRLLTWNFFGICVSGPLYGPISDAIGRKKPLLIALGLFLLGSLITLFAQDYNLMLIGRLLQGLGSGGCFTLGTAIIFDAFQAQNAIRALNQLNSIIPIIMALAPLLGGYLNHSFGFRSNFLAITLFVLVSFIICLFSFDETLPEEKRSPLRIKKVLTDFNTALTNLPFWQTTILISMIFAGYLTFLSITSVLFVVEFGVSKQEFPFFQGAILAAWVIANQFCNLAITRWGIPKVKIAGLSLVLMGGFAFALAVAFAPSNPYLLSIGMLFYAFGGNWILGLYFPEGMEILPDIKGVTASLITSARLLFAGIIVGLASAYYDSTILPVAVVVIGTIFVCVPIIFFYERRKKLNPAFINVGSDQPIIGH